MSKLCPKCQYFVGAPLLSSTALILLGMEFTRAAQVVAGILFHSSIMTSRSCWMLDTWCFSTFRLRMPHMCSIVFRSGDILGLSFTFTLSFISKASIVQALVVSRLDYCNALLAGLPSNTIKPLQMIQNAAARLVFNEPKEPMLHLSSSPCTGCRLQLASSSRHWCLHTERPQAQHHPTSTHYYESTSPPEVWDLLVSDALWYHHREAQNHSPEHSRIYIYIYIYI